METGVSYFSSRDLRHVRADLEEMVEHGCTYVVHCFTETDMTYALDTMRDVVAATREAGLGVWLDPWGLAGIYSGETFTQFPLQYPDTWQVLSDGRRVGAACPNHPQTRSFFKRWVDAASYIGGEVLFWDEPHFYVGVWRGDLSGAFACFCDHCRTRFREAYGGDMPREWTAEVRAFREASLIDFLSGLTAYARGRGMRNALCLIPTDLAAHGFSGPEQRLEEALRQRGRASDAPDVEAMLHVGIGDFERAAGIPALDIFGCDPYWYLFGAAPEPFMRAYGEAAKAAADRHGLGLQLWVQAFSVPEGREDELRTGLRVAEELGATHVAAWSFRGTESMSKIRCVRPDVVWSLIGEEFRRLRGGAARPAPG
jgi:hypothetical protein